MSLREEFKYLIEEYKEAYRHDRDMIKSLPRKQRMFVLILISALLGAAIVYVGCMAYIYGG